MWQFPLEIMNLIGTTIDSYSFLDLKNNDVELPLHPHVGAFGIRRRHDIHKGIDLYANVETKVTTVEDGTIVDICPFTGPKAGFPWWLDTMGIYIGGASGIVVYGEIQVNEKLKIGDFIKQGDFIGTVSRVLIDDRGRPTSMLHLELHKNGHIHCGQWALNKEKPIGILDPTVHLNNNINMDWVNVTDNNYPPEGVDVLVSDGINYDVAWYLMSSEYVWMKIEIDKDDSKLFTSIIPTKWKRLD